MRLPAEFLETHRKIFQVVPFSFKNRRGQEAGNILAAIMAGAAAMATLSVIIFSVVPIFRKQVVRSQDFFSASVALNSVVDYTLFGLRNRWCFTESWLQDPTCTLNHVRNSERLLISTEAMAQIHARPPFPALSTIGLSHIEQTIPINSLSTAHPLYRVLKSLRSNRKSDTVTAGDQASERVVKITLDRLTNVHYPTRGREAVVKVKVVLQETNSLMVLGKFLQKDQLLVESVVAVYPRELSSFALVVANDLHLDLDVNDSTGLPGTNTVGDFYIDKINYKQAMDRGIVGASGSGGLFFNSPVFVNGNLHLPPDLNPLQTFLTQQPQFLNYAPVTFADKVYLGNGVLMRAGNPARPLSAGGSIDKFNGQAVDFGGLLRGVDSDGFRDAGLDVLATGVTGIANNSIQAKCVAIFNSTAELTSNKDSVAMIKQSSHLAAAGDVTGKYVVGMSKINFMKKITAAVKVYETSGPTVVPPALSPGTTTKSIMRAMVQLKSNIPGAVTQLEVQSHAQMERGEKFTVIPDFKPAFITARDAAKVLHDASCIPPAPAPFPQPLCGDLNTKYQTLATLVSGYDAASPKLELTVNPFKIPAGGKVQPHLFEIEVLVKGVQYFQRAEMVPELFDSSYFASGVDVMSNRRVIPPPATTVFSSSEIDRHTKADPVIDLLTDFGTVYKPMWAANSTFAGANTDALEDTVDYASIEEICNQAGGTGGGAFGIADWDISFTTVSRSSWSFVWGPPLYPQRGPKINLTANNSSLTNPLNPPAFQKAAISEECIIHPGANFVTGFFNCDHLTILQRTTPLRIIGTFIVTGGFDSTKPAVFIHPDAYKYGIKWSSIYEPNAVAELQAARILKPGSAAPNCKGIPDDPIWHPYPSIQGLSDTFKCSPMSLRFGKDPFTWTQVDPDCGNLDNTTQKCKKRAMRYLFREIDRRDSL